HLVSSLFVVCPAPSSVISFIFFFNDTATTEIYTLSLHDALPIYRFTLIVDSFFIAFTGKMTAQDDIYVGGRLHELIPKLLAVIGDRKSTRLNSSHVKISYAVFCLKKKKKKYKQIYRKKT